MLGDVIFRVPLHAKAEGVTWPFDAFNHTVRRDGIDHGAVCHLLDGLVVGAVDLEFVHACDAVKQCAGKHFHTVARFGARIWLFVG